VTSDFTPRDITIIATAEVYARAFVPDPGGNHSIQSIRRPKFRPRAHHRRPSRPLFERHPRRLHLCCLRREEALGAILPVIAPSQQIHVLCAAPLPWLFRRSGNPRPRVHCCGPCLPRLFFYTGSSDVEVPTPALLSGLHPSRASKQQCRLHFLATGP
jgi:hypothetical protein